MSTPRPSFADLRLVCDYFRGLRNEIAVDVQAIEMAGLSPDRYGKIPRPSRWIGKARRFALLSRLVQHLSLPIWYFLGPLMFSRQCKAARAISEIGGDSVHLDGAGQVLPFSIRTIDIVHARHIANPPRQWVELPWLPLTNLPPGAEILPAMSLLDEADVRRSLALARIAHRALNGRRGTSGWGLQSYTAWRWFLTRLAVDKLPGPLLTVEHFDRWAVLVDGSVQRSLHRQPKRRLTVMQHGSVNADVTPRGLGLRLPTRLRAVSHLRAYSAADVEVFKDEILSHRLAERGLDVSFYRPSVMLTDMPRAGDQPRILFVGHPLCEPAHCALLQALRRHGDFQIFYKPHPANRASKHIGEQSWTMVEGRSVFPRVDLLISYHSTMIAEYAAHDIAAVVHRMDIPASQILALVPEILQIIQARRAPPPPSNQPEPLASSAHAPQQS